MFLAIDPVPKSTDVEFHDDEDRIIGAEFYVLRSRPFHKQYTPF
jgi:hypothetical protein